MKATRQAGASSTRDTGKTVPVTIVCVVRDLSDIGGCAAGLKIKVIFPKCPPLIHCIKALEFALCQNQDKGAHNYLFDKLVHKMMKTGTHL